MQLSDSLLSGENAAFLDEAYSAWLRDPQSVDPEWAALFAQLDPPARGAGLLPGEAPAPSRRSIFGGAVAASSATPTDAKAVALVIAHRIHGHRWAEIDPLGPRQRAQVPELEPAFHGITPDEMAVEVANPGVAGAPARLTVRALLDHIRRAWCGSLGAEVMDIRDATERIFVRERVERLGAGASWDRSIAERFLRKASDAENFERTLQTRFPGAKRFSLEGGEPLVPLLDLVVRLAAKAGATDFVLGMAHRGRLNTLVNVLEKPVKLVLDEFQDVKGHAHGSGDVKYHLGFSADSTTVDGLPVHLTLTPNPSHLETVDPVVEGRARARQDRFGAAGRQRVVPILIHGDAAFAGQGVVAEVLNLSELHGYRTGGTIHVVVNNQIGFTTPPADSRSTPYCTDVARMLGIPILHVNGEDPAAVIAAVEIAVAWRMTFQRDVVLDLYCFRKHGHNEADEPSFTQPRMYELIRARRTPRDAVAAALVAAGVLSTDDVRRIDAASQAALAASAEAPADAEPLARHAAGVRLMRELWAPHRGGRIDEAASTALPVDDLRALLERVNTLPEGNWHAKIGRLFQQRLEMARGERPWDWGMGETAAFATILAEGTPVRLSGQDCGRGTFTQRHAMVTDTTTEAERAPLAAAGARFEVFDSSLSEYGVLGFEYGYAMDAPDALVLWEAQFGDFANGAQILIDQYLVSAEQKWGRLNGLVLLLPHGYEGQGPEHSSARLERFLQACAEDNIQVAVPTTPASHFHLLRRQARRAVRKPLIVFTPKQLLRHPEAVSTLDEVANGAFAPLIPDPSPPEAVTRLVFCAGKVYYDLAAARRSQPACGAALHRLEQVYPLPLDDIRAALDAHPQAEVVWCQEEPKNMGAWPSLLGWWLEALPAARLPRYAGRPAAAAPATGSYKKHGAEQDRLVRDALGI